MARWKRKYRRPAVKVLGEGKKEMNIRVSAPATTPWHAHQSKTDSPTQQQGALLAGGACLGTPRLPLIYRASPWTGQNQEYSCRMRRLMAHLDHERDVEKDLEQPGR